MRPGVTLSPSGLSFAVFVALLWLIPDRRIEHAVQNCIVTALVMVLLHRTASHYIRANSLKNQCKCLTYIVLKYLERATC